MNIQKLYYQDEILIEDNITMPNDFASSSHIESIEPVCIKGKIDYLYNLYLEVSGIMYLQDSLTLERVLYNYSFTIDENIKDNANYLKNNGNTLDIIQVLWENIILEIPMNVVSSKRTNVKGDGWEIKE